MFDEPGCRHALMAAEEVRSAPADGGVPRPRLRPWAVRSSRLAGALSAVAALAGLTYSLSLVESVPRRSPGGPGTALDVPARSVALPAPGSAGVAGWVTSLPSGAPGSGDSGERHRHAHRPSENPLDPAVVLVASRRPAWAAGHPPAPCGGRWWLSAAPSTGPPLLA